MDSRFFVGVRRIAHRGRKLAELIAEGERLQPIAISRGGCPWNVFGSHRYSGSMIALLALAQAPAGDTIVAIAARDAYDILQALSAAAVAGTFFAVLMLIMYVVVQTRRMAHAVDRTRKRFSADPAVESLRKTAGHVESISRTLNDEVTKLSESVSLLSDRLTQASDRMEERIEEFNAFMEVVQREAEGAFVEGAATARGVRAGLGNLSHPSPSRKIRGTGTGENETDGQGSAGGSDT